MLLELEPAEMTPEVMNDLETKGLIIRLCPGKHAAQPGRNESDSLTIYSSDDAYGPHKLIVATINSLESDKYFGYHDDNEEFLLIGDPSYKTTYLIVAYCKKDELDE